MFILTNKGAEMQGSHHNSEISSKEEEFVPVARFRYIPLAKLEVLDMERETGLERLLYLQSLITEEVEQ